MYIREKTSDHSSPEPDVVSIADTTSDESSGYDSLNYELSDCDSMKGGRSRCNSLESKIYSLFNQYKTDDGKIVISYPYSITSLFGLHIRREEALPTDVAYEDFTQYNPVLLEKISAALDIPFVQKIIRLADTIVLENHAADIKLNKELIEHVRTINSFNAEIENVMITDVNGDKLQDIYFSTRDKAKWIGIMNTDFSISITCIKHGKIEDRC